MTDIDDWDDPEDECEGAPDPESERYFEDGGERDDDWDDSPEPPEDYLIAEAERHARIHQDIEHGGGECDCPRTDPWALPEGETYAEGPPF